MRLGVLTLFGLVTVVRGGVMEDIASGTFSMKLFESGVGLANKNEDGIAKFTSGVGGMLGGLNKLDGFQSDGLKKLVEGMKGPTPGKPTVRKNIYSLAEQERDDFFTLLKLMKNTTAEDGRARYGEVFATYDEITIQHAYATLASDCDRGHFGPAMPWFHRILTRRVEIVLAAIAEVEGLEFPGMPYWDFVEDLKAGKWEEAKIFSDDYFGGEGDPSDSWQIQNGQLVDGWEISESDHPRFKNAFGLLRAPYNPNKARKLTRRFKSYCGVPFPEVTSSGQDACVKLKQPAGVLGFLACADPTVHSSPHFVIGGTWNSSDGIDCFALQVPASSFPKEEGDILVLGGTPGPYVDQWAAGCVQCDPCAPEADPTECFCTYTAETEKEAKDCVDNALLSKAFPVWGLGVLGDMSDRPTATNDPLFWLHHANFDRAFTAWQVHNVELAKAYYGAPDKWPLPKLRECYGHALDDVVNSEDPFINVLEDTPADAPPTLRQIIAATVPGWTLPYDYDDLPAGMTGVLEKQRSAFAEKGAGPLETPAAAEGGQLDLSGLKFKFPGN
uniref:Tyrosinase copper-binding domain-containing protein n=1 Tax=Chromera velia CCMP2878 TaxID=1169474 RepID=A0A0G4HMU6_9ALVE|eukprot:Cvel_7566.t1-p1 / transcript=Cvel_7566.t1 / gene=Cvel_7566 / organism=Chromera_velia_CCMP2878 / gene_product=Tyrosinase, putative / transcript_product=Tyrosinase, putative / location=Cvel_scaffold398:44994-50089(+) / protein_length=556 / sequence_SO=supercontig / SO=protein_coding / is_pseudo=false